MVRGRTLRLCTNYTTSYHWCLGTSQHNGQWKTSLGCFWMHVHTSKGARTDLRLGQDTQPHLIGQGSLSGHHRPASWPHSGHPHTGAPDPGKALHKHTIPITPHGPPLPWVPPRVRVDLPRRFELVPSVCCQCLLSSALCFMYQLFQTNTEMLWKYHVYLFLYEWKDKGWHSVFL